MNSNLTINGLLRDIRACACFVGIYRRSFKPWTEAQCGEKEGIRRERLDEQGTEETVSHSHAINEQLSDPTCIHHAFPSQDSNRRSLLSRAFWKSPPTQVRIDAIVVLNPVRFESHQTKPFDEFLTPFFNIERAEIICGTMRL
jgi:hypothetical protein